ncbi:hypothetical protein EDB84DRAFT_1440107 [Lactarius hengduanensis]|nr:hypothetical protein EDB84DRAFT_1440107 [Lactarius hengduanensis]
MVLPTSESPPPSQLRSRVRKVTLRVSRPSAPDAPAAIPVLPPLPPPLPEGHRLPQTPPVPPLPPLQPPHLPPMGGPPNQFSGQYSSAGLAMNVPPTYAHPYGAMSYPPPYPPVPHHSPYGAGVGAAPFQPWGYAPYPMAPPPGLFPTGRDGDVGANDAAPSSTLGARPARPYPNREVSDGVWRFQTEVVDGHMKHAFTAQTDMKWLDFLGEVLHRLDRPRSEVRVVFRISGEGGAWKDLASEYDWADGIARLVGKARSARTRAVSMEVKDMHESARAKSKGKGKGKEKRRREDDIPPALSPDMTRQLDCLIKLQQHVACNKHSAPGKKVYCFVEQSAEDASGGHEKLTHEDMTLWAKHMSLGKATIHRPPNVIKFDHRPAKRARTERATPTPGPSRLARVNDSPPCTPSSVAGPSTLRPPRGPWPSRILVVLDCLKDLRVPMLMELLSLMDEYEPADGLSYVDIGEEFTDLGIMDSVDLYSLPLELLASFGGLGHDLAHRLHQFCEKLFIPLGFKLVETMDGDIPEYNSQQEVALQDGAPRSIGDVHTDEAINVSDEETSDGTESDDSEATLYNTYRETSYEV